MQPASFKLRHQWLQLALTIDITSPGISSLAAANDNDEDTNTPMKENDGNGEDDIFSNTESYTISSYPLTLGNVIFVEENILFLVDNAFA